MRTGDVVVAIVLAVIFAAVFAVLFDLARLVAKAMVRQAARWWHSELDTPEDLAAEWQDLIDTRPVGLLKICAAIALLTPAMLRQSRHLAPPPPLMAGIPTASHGLPRSPLSDTDTNYVGIRKEQIGVERSQAATNPDLLV